MDRYDLAATIGAIILTAGVWMIFPPAALIALGMIVIAGSLVFAPPDKSGPRPDLED